MMKKSTLIRYKLIGAFCLDMLSLTIASLAALLIMQKGVISPYIAESLGLYLIVALPFIIAASIVTHVYRQMWEFATVSGLIRIFLAVFITQAASVIAGNLTGTLFGFSFYFLNLFLISSFMWGYRARRAIVRKLASYMSRIETRSKSEMCPARKKVLLVGAGQAAAIFLRDYENNRQNTPFRMIGMVDDDKNKIGRVLHGVTVLGECSKILDISQRYDVEEIIVAIPSAKNSEMNRILKLCRSTKCRVRVMPFIEQFGTMKLEDIYPNLKELIGRPEYTTDCGTVQKMITGKRVLVSGGGGSIGSELCRQIMRFGPEKLIIVDLYENSTYDLYKELMDKYGADGQAI
ncbi:MAG: polysaccharide biosynthesis protein, partial [Eubacteriales bacterium]